MKAWYTRQFVYYLIRLIFICMNLTLLRSCVDVTWSILLTRNASLFCFIWERRDGVIFVATSLSYFLPFFTCASFFRHMLLLYFFLPVVEVEKEGSKRWVSFPFLSSSGFKLIWLHPHVFGHSFLGFLFSLIAYKYYHFYVPVILLGVCLLSNVTGLLYICLLFPICCLQCFPF